MFSNANKVLGYLKKPSIFDLKKMRTEDEKK